MANKWLSHVKHTMKQMKSRGTYKKGDGLKKVIMEAKKSYKKHKKGGASDGSASDTPAPAPAPAPAPEVKPEVPVGGRKRGTRRTRRHRK
jgi:hypothetical protein